MAAAASVTGPSRGALTTAFKPVASCLTDTYMYTGSGYYYLSLGPPNNLAECFPTSYATASTNYYSPGISCPNGYYQACSSTEALGAVTETRATCCPSNYKCNTNIFPTVLSNQVCQSAVSKFSVLTYTTIQAQGGANTVHWTAGAVDAINGFGINIRYQASDLTAATTTALTTTPTSSNTIPSETGTKTAASSIGSNTSVPENKSNGGLSTGGKAGIGAAIGLVALIAIVVAVVFWLRRRKRYQSDPYAYDKPPETGPNLVAQEVRPEVRHEMEVRPAELGSGTDGYAHEMWVNPQQQHIPGERP